MAENTSILFDESELENEIIKKLQEGEESGFTSKFDRKEFFKNLHEKYLTEGH